MTGLGAELPPMADGLCDEPTLPLEGGGWALKVRRRARWQPKAGAEVLMPDGRLGDVWSEGAESTGGPGKPPELGWLVKPHGEAWCVFVSRATVRRSPNEGTQQ